MLLIAVYFLVFSGFLGPLVENIIFFPLPGFLYDMEPSE